MTQINVLGGRNISKIPLNRWVHDPALQGLIKRYQFHQRICDQLNQYLQEKQMDHLVETCCYHKGTLFVYVKNPLSTHTLRLQSKQLISVAQRVAKSINAIKFKITT